MRRGIPSCPMAPSCACERSVANGAWPTVGRKRWCCFARPGGSQGVVLLELDPEGDGYIVWPDETTTWCSELLRYQVHESDGCQFIVEGSNRRWLNEFFRSHTLCIASIRTMEHRQKCDLKVARFDRPQVGARLWWAWDSVWELLGLKFGAARMSCSKFVLKRWCAWPTWLESLGMPCPTLRKARPYATDQGAQSEERVLPFHSVSTLGLVAVLCRMSCNSSSFAGGMSNERNLQSTCLALHSLLERIATAAPLDFLVFFDRRASCEFPLPAVGAESAGLRIKIQGGMVSLAGEATPEFMAAASASLGSSELVHAWLSSLSSALGRGNSAQIAYVLQHLVLVPKLFKQFVWYIGMALDDTISHERSRNDEQPMHIILSGCIRDDPCLCMRPIQQDIGDGATREREGRLLRYLLAGLRALGGGGGGGHDGRHMPRKLGS